MCVLKEVKRGVFFLFFFFFSCVCLKMEWEHRSFLHFFCVFLDRLSRSNISNEIDLGFAWIDVVLSIFIIIMRSCDSGYSGTLEMFCLRTRRFESCHMRFCFESIWKSETNKMRCFGAISLSRKKMQESISKGDISWVRRKVWRKKRKDSHSKAFVRCVSRKKKNHVSIPSKIVHFNQISFYTFPKF